MIESQLVKKPRKKNIKPPKGPHTIIFPEGVVMEHQWVYNGSPLLEIPENIVGFVYIITNKINGKKYIGKKQFFSTKIRSIKKQKYRERVQSDFITYYGSNDELNEDVIQNGEDNFCREILLLCETLGQMSYFEAKYQMHYDVIGSDKWYNSWVSVRTTSKHLKPHHFNHKIKENL